GTPIIPVEEGKISPAETPSNLPASRHTFSQARRPARPVAQLALPEFTTIARIRPLPDCTAARPTSTGAATTRFVVNSAAALAPPLASASARSGRPLTLMPAATAAKENPCGKRIVSGALLSDFRCGFMPESSASFSAAVKSQTSEAHHESSELHRSDTAAGTGSSLCESCRADLDDSRW